MKKTYDVVINKDEQWVWTGESPEYVDGNPFFRGREKMYLRLDGQHGLHTINLKQDENGDFISPFDAPHDKPTFTYHSDHDVLHFARRQPGTVAIGLSFTLISGTVSIDPEFHVGTGTDQD
jgi:hypothetical protein